MTRDETVTRRIIACILGLFGIVILIDVAVISIMRPDVDYDGFRQVFFVIIGALLVCCGAVTFAWPKHGRVETLDDATTAATDPAHEDDET